MAITSKRDVDNLHKLVKKLKNIQGTMLAIGNTYSSEVIKSWNKGKNVQGQAFKKLSAGYKRQKIKAGKKGIPDLDMSGDLRDTLDIKIKKKGVNISIGGEYAEYRADRDKAVGLWGMNETLNKRLVKFMKKRLSPV